MDISVVVPVKDEEKNVSILHFKLKEVLNKMNKKYELIFVDDGSTDKTLDELKKLKNIKIISLRKNFGQTAALSAGIEHAKGKLIVTIDGDLQNDPEDIPRLIRKLEEGYDCVSGWRAKRKDPILTKLYSRFGSCLRRRFLGTALHDYGCTLKVYKKECFDELTLFGEMHRYIPPLLRWKGFKVGEIKVNHFARKHGKTNYKSGKIVRGFLDMFNVWFYQKYSGRPLHIFGGLGLISMFLGFVSLIYLAYMKIFRGLNLSSHFLSTVSVFLILMGVLFFISGILADIMIKNYYSFEGRKSYSVKEVIEK